MSISHQISYPARQPAGRSDGAKGRTEKNQSRGDGEDGGCPSNRRSIRRGINEAVKDMEK